MSSRRRKPIAVGFIVEDRFDMKIIYENLKSLGFYIVPTYTNNPMNKNQFPISSVEYVEEREGFIGDILAVEQINGYTYWIECGNIENNLISIIPMDEVAFPQVMRNIKGVIPNVETTSIALTPKLSKLYGEVDYILNPTMPMGELRDALIDVLMEIKYEYR